MSPGRNKSPSKKLMIETSPLKTKSKDLKKGFEIDDKKPIPIISKDEDEELRSSIKFVPTDKPVPSVIDEPKKS